MNIIIINGYPNCGKTTLRRMFELVIPNVIMVSGDGLLLEFIDKENLKDTIENELKLKGYDKPVCYYLMFVIKYFKTNEKFHEFIRNTLNEAKQKYTNIILEGCLFSDGQTCPDGYALNIVKTIFSNICYVTRNKNVG